jgi:hypothetical protein
MSERKHTRNTMNALDRLDRKMRAASRRAGEVQAEAMAAMNEDIARGIPLSPLTLAKCAKADALSDEMNRVASALIEEMKKHFPNDPKLAEIEEERREIIDRIDELHDKLTRSSLSSGLVIGEAKKFSE